MMHVVNEGEVVNKDFILFRKGCVGLLCTACVLVHGSLQRSFLDPKAPSVVARAVELRVRPRATHNDNVGGNSAISSVHAGAKALEGNIL